METPSSTARIVTRSQTTLAASNNSSNNNIPVSRIKIEDSEKNLTKARQRDRSALVDISNDSPIVGLANVNGGDLETPLSSIAKQRVKHTPGSGEALLRGQVKTLLQKVEEEADTSKPSMQIRPFLQLVNSPMGLLAPTPANTPQILNLSCNGDLNNSATGLASLSPSPIVEEQLISRVVDQIFDGNDKENPEFLISRSLFLDFSDKSEVSECTSELTYQEVVQDKEEKPQGSSNEDDDVASIWSLQVNASTHDEDAEEEEEIAEEEEDYYEDVIEEEYDDGGLLLDELCAGLNNISVNEKEAPKFAGKHTRFVYDSDDELVEEVEVEYCDYDEIESASSSSMRLKGLPTPKGKHLRFPEEEEKSAL